MFSREKTESYISLCLPPYNSNYWSFEIKFPGLRIYEIQLYVYWNKKDFPLAIYTENQK